MEEIGAESLRSSFGPPISRRARHNGYRKKTRVGMKGGPMAEKQTGMTPAREERRSGLTRPWESSGIPFRTLQRMADEMDRIFEDFGLGSRWARPLWREPVPQAWTPEVDVFQKNHELTIRMDLPGLNREDVSVDITDNQRGIQGQRKHHS